MTNKDPQQEVISSFEYTYDAAGRRTQVKLPDGTINCAYDESSRLIQETRDTTEDSYSISYEYDPAGNRLKMTKGQKTYLYDYNQLNQLTQQREEGHSQGLITVTGTINEAAAVSVNDKSAAVDTKTGTFTADSIPIRSGDNLLMATAKDLAGNTSTSEIQVKAIDPTEVTYTYDKNGNLVSRLSLPGSTEGAAEAISYIYDYENRLTSVKNNNDVIASYTYDAEGKRTSSTEDGTTTRYLYDGLLPIIERSPTGTTTTTYTRGPSLGGGIGGIISRHASPPIYYHYDGLGNVMNLTDSTGNVTTSYTYDAFGNTIAQTGTSANPYQFSTKPYNPTTGLVHFGFRYYDPSIGRFTTVDPLGMVNGPNLYAYVSNNPVNLIDPYGLSQKGPRGDSPNPRPPDPKPKPPQPKPELPKKIPWWQPTPARGLRWGGRILQQVGLRGLGRTLGITGIILEPGGTGKVIGIIVGGTTGAIKGAGLGSAIGSAIALGPGTAIGGLVGGVTGGIFGGALGGWVGSQFDYPGAGQLNYNEWEGYDGVP